MREYSGLSRSDIQQHDVINIRHKLVLFCSLPKNSEYFLLESTTGPVIGSLLKFHSTCILHAKTAKLGGTVTPLNENVKINPMVLTANKWFEKSMVPLPLPAQRLTRLL